jgi:hypothetical protein
VYPLNPDNLTNEFDFQHPLQAITLTDMNFWIGGSIGNFAPFLFSFKAANGWA